MNASTGTGERLLGNVDPRLIVLDPDFEELFAEVDEALCAARARWLPWLRTTDVPQSRATGSGRASPRPQRRQRDRFRARERGPPERRSGPRHPSTVWKRGDARSRIRSTGSARGNGTTEPTGLQCEPRRSPSGAPCTATTRGMPAEQFPLRRRPRLRFSQIHPATGGPGRHRSSGPTRTSRECVPQTPVREERGHDHAGDRHRPSITPSYPALDPLPPGAAPRPLPAAMQSTPPRPRCIGPIAARCTAGGPR